MTADIETFFFLALFRIKAKFNNIWNCGKSFVKGVQVAVCGTHSINLNDDTWKLLSTHFFCKKKIERRKKLYKTVTDNQRVLKIWKTRNLTLEGKILNFEIIVISKVVFQSFITSVLKHCERTWKNTKSFFLEKLYS